MIIVVRGQTYTKTLDYANEIGRLTQLKLDIRQLRENRRS